MPDPPHRGLACLWISVFGGLVRHGVKNGPGDQAVTPRKGEVMYESRVVPCRLHPPAIDPRDGLAAHHLPAFRLATGGSGTAPSPEL